MKIKLLSTLLISSLVLTACTSKNTEDNKEQPKQENKTETAKKDEKKVYNIGEEWIVDGQWKLKINSVTTTEDRNQFSDDKPAQVVIIDYTYENLGYKKDIQDLYFMPTSVIDGGKKVAKSYPASIQTHPQPTPEGAIMENAQSAFGLNTESSDITVFFELYDNNKKLQTAEFKVPVTK